MDISVIIPIYNEQENIPILHNELKTVLKGYKYEIIYIDDGSTDHSFQVLEKIKDRNTKIIKLKKRFTKSPALLAGFNNSEGNIVITMDGDLQNDPKDIPKFLEKIGDYDLVNGWRINRQDEQNKILPSKIYNKLTRRILKTKLHDLNCGMKAIKKEVIKDIDLYGEMHRYFPLLLQQMGYKITEIKINHRLRIHGKSKYNYNRLLKGLYDLIYLKFWLDFSQKPSHFFSTLGLAQYILAFFIFLEQIIKAVALRYFNVGPVLLLGILLTITGTLFITSGFLAEIQARIYFSTKKTYIIEKIIQNKKYLN
ncbi:glycosyltransferase family 2 protein [Candidatus Woesearchaeota archaeon]|nr:glycosyltransferase family 2 protein [Candidatus Woesearchaeota archaeon]